MTILNETTSNWRFSVDEYESHLYTVFQKLGVPVFPEKEDTVTQELVP